MNYIVDYNFLEAKGFGIKGKRILLLLANRILFVLANNPSANGVESLFLLFRITLWCGDTCFLLVEFPDLFAKLRVDSLEDVSNIFLILI